MKALHSRIPIIKSPPQVVEMYSVFTGGWQQHSLNQQMRVQLSLA